MPLAPVLAFRSPFWQRHRHGLVLLVILGLALVVRLHHLMAQGLWTDEMISLYTSNPEVSLRRTYDVLHFWDQTPPLYPVWLWLWLKLTGFTDVQARLFSVLGGMLSLVAIHRLVVDFFSRRAALAVTLIVALTPYHIYFSREARSYIWGLLLATLFLHALLLRLSGDDSRRCRFALVLSGALLLLVSYFAFFIHAAAVMTMALLVACRRLSMRLRPWLIDYALIGLLFLPWLLPFLRILSFHNGSNGSAPSPWYVLEMLSVFSSVSSAGLWLALAYGALLMLTVPALLRFSARDPRQLVMLVAGLVFLIAYLLMFVKSATGRNILNGFAFSYVIVLFPCYLLLLAGLLDRLRPGHALAFLAAFLTFNGLHADRWSKLALDKKQSEPYRELATLISRSGGSEAPILAAAPYIQEFYLSRLNLSRNLVSLVDVQALLSSSQPPARLWIVDSYDRKADTLLRDLRRAHPVNSVRTYHVKAPVSQTDFRAILVSISLS